MESTFVKGRNGEDIACKFLVENGYSILGRNFVYRGHEIDIIAQDRNEIVFVEVKERATNNFGEPYKAVNRRKQQYIIGVANYYMQKFKITLEARFDIISIIMNNENIPEIEHIPHAFMPEVSKRSTAFYGR